MRRTILAAILVLAVTAVPTQADFEEGVAAYKRRDYAAALREFLPLAEAGDDAAQLILGAMYAAGEGVRQDYAEAVAWYRRAAEQGNAAAQNSLGVMYEHGLGVQGDLMQAYAWYNLAAAHEDPNPSRENAVRNRNRVARQLTAQQLEYAQRLARDLDSTLASLGGASPPPTPAAPAQDAARPHEPAPAPPPTGFVTPLGPIQKRLSMLGYDPGPRDGTPSPKTRAAIRAFERDRGLPVTGNVSKELLAALRAARPCERKLKRRSAASGFAVSRAGHFLSTYHVVKECCEVRIPPNGAVKHVASDTPTDLALLKGGFAPAEVATFREGRGILQGDTVVAAGFPLQGLITSDLTITTGIVSALAGPRDDRRVVQITAPIQTGNSGGPLLDLSGNTVGVVVAKLDALKVAQQTGDLPQNVNFAISAGAARVFLDAHGVAYETAPSERTLAATEVAARARKITVLVECWK